MKKKKTPIVPRLEAQLLDWALLTPDQRLVVERTGQLLGSASRAGWKQQSPLSPEFLPVIDHDRANRVIFIDGQRGSGKSSVLLSIVNTYSAHARGADLVTSGYSDHLLKTDHIWPVGLLDLDPLPGVSNLLLQILAPLDGVVGAILGREHAGRAPGLLAPAQSPALEMRWRDLRHMVARTWVQTSGGIVGQRDSAAFAYEEIETADERTHVATAFRLFMDLLVESFRETIGQGAVPMFLLSIDDADMSPSLSAPLLTYLRTLWHPRLAYLLTGDYDLLKERVRSAMFPGVAGLEILAAAIPGARVPREANTLPDEVLRKVIPKSHRLSISRLEPSLRLGALPELRSRLSSLAVEADLIPKSTYPLKPDVSLLDFVQAYDRPPGSGLLPDRMRLLVDFSAELQSTNPSVAGVLLGRWKELVDEAPRLSTEAKAELSRSVSISTDGRLLTRPPVLVLSTTPRARMDVAIDVRRFTTLASIQECRLEFQGEPLTSDLAAAWFALSDLALHAAGGREIGWAFWETARISLPFGSTSIEIEGHELSCPWPSPRWDSVLELQTFAREWEEVLQQLQKQEVDQAVLVAKFLVSILDLAERNVHDKSKSPASNWRDLGLRVAGLAARRYSGLRDASVSGWAIKNALVFACPELCPDEDAAREYLHAIRSSIAQWDLLVVNARQVRRGWYLAKEELNQSELAEELRDIAPGHPWWEVVETEVVASSQKTRVIESLADKLSRATLPFGKDHFNQDRLAANLYLTPARRGLLAQASLSALVRASKVLDTVGQASR